MTGPGLLKVIDALGLTIQAMEDQIAQLQKENGELRVQLSEPPADRKA